MSNSREITAVEAAAILINSVLGIGILNMPRFMVEAAGTGAPIVTIIGVLFVFISVWGITKLGMSFPTQSIVQYSERIIGKWLGRAYIFIAIIVFIFAAGLLLREFSEVLNTAVLFETPIEVSALVILFLAAYFTRDSLNTFAYIHLFYAPFIFIPGIIIAALSIPKYNYLYLQPLFRVEVNEWFTGITSMAPMFQGVFVLTIIIPFMKQPGLVMKASFWGTALAGGVYVITVISALAIAGPEELKTMMWPALEHARSVEVPGNFLERLGIVFLITWVIAVFTTIFSYYMIIVNVLRQLFRTQDHRMFSFFLFPLIFGVAMIPENVVQLYKGEMAKIVNWMGVMFLMGFPLLLVIVMKLRGLPLKGSGKKSD
ncbi:GerAB/ArcD/ProY family transporter [Alteribacillus iranensis]|uniref:Spore germination protein (Amino acid permease) n=1 Tax=Alteribacillus iranensis TaxID=930128 RepID=A0A1I2DK11_9BACI|nr:endospore germination permease [Alteribacillus iranensis]SFE80789.1 spore germination protein (amino acid permease) [Alteribacillus iranensis]